MSRRELASLAAFTALVTAVLGLLFNLVFPSEPEGVTQAELDLVVAEAVEEAVEEAVAEALAGVEERLAAEVERGLASGLAGLADADERRVAEVFAEVAESVVVIDAEGPQRVNAEGVVTVPAALATGFVLDADGHIVTAAHVLEGMTTFTVIQRDGRRYEAAALGNDQPFSDVAVLRVLPQAGEAPLLAPPRFRLEPVRAGEPVLAIGNTLLGAEIAVTAGVVSDADTTFFRERAEQVDLIQTDAALNHGNSGGVLVDLAGEIVGMTVVIARSTLDGEYVDGIGFAIQIAPVLEVARAIAAQGYYPRPSFGVVDERLLNPAAAAQLGVGVTAGAFLIEITRAGPFAQAGIRPGDVLVALNDTPIDAETPYLNALARLEPEVPVRVVVHRGGEDYVLNVTPALRAP